MVLGAIAGLGVLMLVVLLYIRNKGWWWGTVSGMSCCDEACPPVSSRPVPTPPVPSAISPVPIKNKLGKLHKKYHPKLNFFKFSFRVIKRLILKILMHLFIVIN